MIPRKLPSTVFCSFPVREKRFLKTAEVPASWVRSEGPVKCKVPHSPRSQSSESNCSTLLLTFQVFRPFEAEVLVWLSSQTISLPLFALTHKPFRSMYISISKDPVTCTVRYEAGIACRKVDVGVMGERKDSIISAGSSLLLGAGILYVRFVVEASNVAPA
jgi:hypothetical protein